MLPLAVMLIYRYGSGNSYEEIYMERGLSNIWDARPVHGRIGADEKLRTRNFLALEGDVRNTSCLDVDDEGKSNVLKSFGKSLIFFGRKVFRPAVNIPVKLCGDKSADCYVDEGHYIHAKVIFHSMCPNLNYTIRSR